jgi:hypothetical protein
MRILALDPGGTTGWALYQGGPFALMDNPQRGIKLGHIGPMEHHLQLKEFIETEISHDFMLVCESFEYRRDQRDNVNLISKEYIGVVKRLQQERASKGTVPLRVHFQTAAKGKGFWTDQKIKKLGLWWPGHKHAMDALRHLLHYQAFGLNDQDLLRRLK